MTGIHVDCVPITDAPLCLRQRRLRQNARKKEPEGYCALRQKFIVQNKRIPFIRNKIEDLCFGLTEID
jgi:hypothetical protein